MHFQLSHYTTTGYHVLIDKKISDFEGNYHQQRAKKHKHRLIKIINIFYEYLSSYLNINLLYSYPRMHHSINNLIGFNLKLVRIKVCKEPIDLTHKIIYTKCYHIWYPLYYNALIDLFR